METTDGESAEPPPQDDQAGQDAALATVLEQLSNFRSGDALGDRAPLVREFARSTLRRVPDAQLRSADPVATASAVADAFAFVDRRKPGEISVRVTDPEVVLDGSRPGGTVVEVACDDRRFIVSTVTEELHRLGYTVARSLHPVLGCERRPDGTIVAIVPARTAEHRESFLQAELGEKVDPRLHDPLIEAVRRVLADVFAATGDEDAMRRRITEVAAETRARADRRYPSDEVAEAADFLEWLLHGNFVVAGCSDLPHAASEGATPLRAQVVDALGILQDVNAPLRLLPPDDDAGDHLLSIRSTAQVSTVHRQVPMHRVDVIRVGPDGEGSGVFRIVGVLSRKASSEPAVSIPVVRLKLRRVLELEDVLQGSQDEATLVSLFEALPRDELLESDVPSLRRTLVELLSAEQRHDVRALVRLEPDSRTVSALLSIPTELYSSSLRRRLERFLLTQLDGVRVDADVALADRPEALLRLVVHVAAPVGDVAVDALERELRLLCRTWEQELAAALVDRVGEERATRLGRSATGWFPGAYRETVPAHRAVGDVLQVDALLGGASEGGDIRIVLVPDPGGRAQARLKVYAPGAGVELSGFLPILESLGLWAVEDLSYVVAGGRVHLHDFGVRDPTSSGLDVAAVGRRLSEAALALWHGRAEVDLLNQLVLRSDMSWQDVAVLRAYRRYRKQVGTAFTTNYVDRVLVEHAASAKALVDLFAARFDPSWDEGPEVADELRRQVVDGCDAVALLDHDRILRGFLGVVDATVRTNRYVRSGDHLALKLQSSSVPDVPRPVPYREIFVHGPSVEGIHLRWGPVARGGIRWSDRLDDYRAEVLDLLRAQVLKNAVIVPTGAKGGFVVKGRRYGEQAVGAAEAYELFVTSLLEVTDNVVDERVVPVPRRRDADDPYLVVAADRGTATFSDLANRISRHRGFWLGGAFASGGSDGYDHKALGITARGAWVAVRQHLAELGVDPESEAVTVVGIGDMSGDVFGNGMLRSPTLRLVAAFDHRDIFVDPDPDPAVSYRERARLFALPGSSWQDYDRSLISPGGGVWSRLEKRILLSSEAQEALRVADEYPTAAELIRAILQAPATLLFAGGIGTFVRASTEPDEGIDDRANTDVRVTASSVRARVVGEGANLAFTQRARIEYARRGGHINTDSIDNSAGVDISDHEVNIKILLGLAVESGELDDEGRGSRLHEVCDDVVEAVLTNCALQSMALARAHAASPADIEALEALMAELEGGGVVDRAVEALPSSDDMRSRGRAGAGLTRPELAVLLAGAKRSLAAQLLASPVPDQPAARSVLVRYFPPKLSERFDHLLDRHRLRRELVSSMLANEVVNRMGPTFVSRMTVETRAEGAAVAAAYLTARSVTDAPDLWTEVDQAGRPGRVDAMVSAAAVVSELLESLVRAYLRRGEGDDVAAVVARDRAAFDELAQALPDIGTPYRRRARARLAETLTEQGVEPGLADLLTATRDLAIGPDVAELTRRTGRAATPVASTLLWLGESLGVDRLLRRLEQTAAPDRWSRAARRGLADDLTDLRRLGTRRALEEHPDQPESEAVVRFLAARVDRIADVARLVAELESEPSPRLDAVTVATRAVRRAIG
ncbi:MAG TPA: NAD-glutamate dehydrogenase domain-containing protein [Acidimicrobiales bacterium]|nr:NAD-glutamate dehydrogenase domain-containing protein [Acidimicrobiales bacterium]